LICVFKCVEPCRTLRCIVAVNGRCWNCTANRVGARFVTTISCIRCSADARPDPNVFPYAVQVLPQRSRMAGPTNGSSRNVMFVATTIHRCRGFRQGPNPAGCAIANGLAKTLDEIVRTSIRCIRNCWSLPVDYYWSVYQSEWASDVVFRERADAQRLFGQWCGMP